MIYGQKLIPDPPLLAAGGVGGPCVMLLDAAQKRYRFIKGDAITPNDESEIYKQVFSRYKGVDGQVDCIP